MVKREKASRSMIDFTKMRKVKRLTNLSSILQIAKMLKQKRACITIPILIVRRIAL